MTSLQSRPLLPLTEYLAGYVDAVLAVYPANLHRGAPAVQISVRSPSAFVPLELMEHFGVGILREEISPVGGACRTRWRVVRWDDVQWVLRSIRLTSLTKRSVIDVALEMLEIIEHNRGLRALRPTSKEDRKRIDMEVTAGVRELYSLVDKLKDTSDGQEPKPRERRALVDAWSNLGDRPAAATAATADPN